MDREKWNPLWQLVTVAMFSLMSHNRDIRNEAFDSCGWIADESLRLCERTTFGGTTKTALRHLAFRTGSPKAYEGLDRGR
jgi:hypothetical protein